MNKSTEVENLESAKVVAYEFLRNTAKTICDENTRFEVIEIIKKNYGWIMFWSTQTLGEDKPNVLFGNAPIIVNKYDGSIEYTSTGNWKRSVKRYERKHGFSDWWRFW